MTAVIYAATDLKDRRVEVTDDAVRGRALVRAVDGMRGIDAVVAQWRATANALADPERRQVLLGSVSEDDFIPVARHS